MCDSKSLRPIPGYNGTYRISLDGRVFNKRGCPLRFYDTSRGPVVELHHQGQREKVLVEDLLRCLEDSNDDSKSV